MKKITIIVTMAGRGKRFADAGYTCPKYMITARTKTLFEWSLDSLTDCLHHASDLIFIVQRDDDACGFIRNIVKGYTPLNPKIIELDHVTRGQAETVMKAIPSCAAESPILVYNIDTYVEPGELKFSYLQGDGHIPCFKAEGTHWSFVRLDDYGSVLEVAEKQRISDNCSIGAYYFSSAMLYSAIYHETYGVGKKESAFEEYIAPMYNTLIRRGLAVTISIIDGTKVHVLGTPAELEEFVRQC